MRYLSFCLLLVTLVSCTSQKERDVIEIKTNLDLVDQGFNDNKLDTAASRKAETEIKAFVAAYPEDSLSAGYLFKLGMLYQKQRNFKEAIDAFDKVYTDYPTTGYSRNAVFLQGFLYANELNNLDKAKEKYELYLEKYSGIDPKMTSDVQMELQNLGKSPDEILKEIQAKEGAAI